MCFIPYTEVELYGLPSVIFENNKTIVYKVLTKNLCSPWEGYQQKFGIESRVGTDVSYREIHCFESILHAKIYKLTLEYYHSNPEGKYIIVACEVNQQDIITRGKSGSCHGENVHYFGTITVKAITPLYEVN